jgi:SNF family Na+-dependent transporter
MAVAGSAVGLGNFLRFPGQAAQYGGGAFMLAYFVALLIIGLPICWAEWTMGRRAGQNGFHSCPGIFHFFVRRKWGKYLGAIGVVVPVVIYMYYVVIEAWCLGYAVNFLTGGAHFTTTEEAGAFFASFTGVGEDGSALGLGLQHVGIFLLFAFALNFFLIYRGITKGIEWFCRFAMPTLLVLAVIILIRALTLGTPNAELPENNVNNGLGFMWNPVKIVLEENTGTGWERTAELVGTNAVAEAEQRVAGSPDTLRLRSIGVLEQLRNPQLWLAAAGQIFFSLSVGFGIILTYASYLRPEDDVVLSGLSATSANEVCEVGLGGLITLPASVAFLGIGTVAATSSTFGLGFHVLPLVFSQMPFGALFGFLFFFLLFLAAVTSSLSMLQPGIAFLEEAMGIGRKMSASLLGFVTAVGTGFVVFFSADLKALDTLDFWVGTFLIFVLATLQILVFGWVWGARHGLQEANRGSILQLPPWLGWVMKYLSPVFLLGIFFMWLLVNVFGYRFGAESPNLSNYIKDLFVEPNLVAWMSVGIILLVLGLVCAIIANARPYQTNRPETSAQSKP